MKCHSGNNFVKQACFYKLVLELGLGYTIWAGLFGTVI